MSRELCCVNCGRAMREVVHRDVTVDACDCGAMWFDADEIEAWARGREALPHGPGEWEPAAGSKQECPHCKSENLSPRQAKSVRFGYCTNCAGIWLPATSVADLDPAFGKEGQGLGLEAVRFAVEFIGAIWS